MSCPMCKAEADPKYRPFCSGRCADLDLAKWFNGSYATPSRDPEDMDAAIDAAEAALNVPQKQH
ncbi:DNA gyrase inhibitor YacG [Sulfitobacter geojensis]|uniref:DNA gyrase inhibitor YacG n=1 Tax=Sulfitobacter geojensis TaxID=1342299 RepID=A0AAE2VYZ0_9RHOB|nr:DNA gyrase inhibitor YacG [Sulfitobacter geojensis]MBM1690029.1 DNA gyrase inhibitor YacG [Sulfitobacter geojensis]MBM1694095.1 DNA gyrase inhibitor YacG [Sulfitobacter geojensis]MBM1706261.1 DNA gyrase inhibitor YacG [Sulfitobacter geojensis]MBM1710319.1 DNA gyrase inhibitor YacG [Sulfitobacter geojensis]MBM1714385.1 DNA gyrase inhibitor YacG [Sulfitobacter geojensis]